MNRFFRIAFSFILVIGIQSCGMERADLSILVPPEKSTTSITDQYFEFLIPSNAHDPDDSSKFLGLEIYYHFYKLSVDPNLYSNLENETELKNAGFRRVTYYVTNADPDTDTVSYSKLPLIKIPHFPFETMGDNRRQSKITVRFADMTLDVEPIMEIDALDVFNDPTDIPPKTVNIRRSIQDGSTGFFKPFNKLEIGDADLQGMTEADLESFYVMLYVYSYGKYELTMTITSYMVPLSYIEISKPVE